MLAVMLLLLPLNCYAYIDPNTGGWLFQLLFPVLIAISAGWAIFRRHLSDALRRIFVICRFGGMPWRQSELVRAILIFPLFYLGIAIPLEVLGHIDGYLMYLRPYEILPIFGWIWVICGIFAFALAGIAVYLPALLAKKLRKSPATWAFRIGAWSSTSMVGWILLRSVTRWMEAKQIAGATRMEQSKWMFASGIAVICAIWVWRRTTLPIGLVRLAQIGSLCGLALTLVAPLSVWLSSEAPLTPTIAESSGTAPAKLPNIILLTVDTLAANHASLYGYGRSTTPYLEQLARQANVFERFYANSNFTTPSVNSLLHGQRPWTHRGLQHRARVDLAIAVHGLAPRLKSAGYQTFAVATNILASPYQNRSDSYFDRTKYAGTNFIFDRQLSLFNAMFPNSIHAFDSLIPRIVLGVAAWIGTRAGEYDTANHYDPELAFSAARELVQNRNITKPMFLWVHIFPPHDPYATPAPFIGRFDSGSKSRSVFDSSPPYHFAASMHGDFPARYLGRYDEAVAYADDHLGAFIDWLKAIGLYDDALLVISADHGESFSHQYGGHAGPLLIDDLIHIPLIIKEPNQSDGKRVDVLAEQIDIMPTILDIAGISIQGTVEGRSLKPAIKGEKMDGPIFAMNFQQSNRFGELHTGSVAMIDEYWKYVHYRGKHRYPEMPKLEDGLFDLKLDPAETTNLIMMNPQIAAKMRAVIDDQLRRHGGPVR